MRRIEIIEKIFEPDYFISNYENFSNELNHRSYDKLFADRFAYDFGHTTPEGSLLIAKNVHQKIIQIYKEKFKKVVRSNKNRTK